MEFNDLDAIVDRKVAEMDADLPRAWAACAAIWIRTHSLATHGLARWPEFRIALEMALMAALPIAVVTAPPSASAAVMDGLSEFNVEDDGSADWQYVVDMIAELQPVLGGRDAHACLRVALATYLGGTFNVAANDLARATGRPISQAEAVSQIATHDEWHRAIMFVRSL